jgi:hypothetical protein
MAWGIPGNVGEIYRKQQSDELKDQLLQQEMAQRIRAFEAEQEYRKQTLAAQAEERAALERDRAANRADQLTQRQRQGAMDTLAISTPGPITEAVAGPLRAYAPTASLITGRSVLPAQPMSGPIGEAIRAQSGITSREDTSGPQNFAVREPTPAELETTKERVRTGELKKILGGVNRADPGWRQKAAAAMSEIDPKAAFTQLMEQTPEERRTQHQQDLADSEAVSRRNALFQEGLIRGRGTAGAEALQGDLGPLIGRAMGANFPANRRPAVIAQAKQYLDNNDREGLKQWIVQTAIETEGMGAREQITGRRQAARALSDIRTSLQELQKAGVDTNLLTGTIEDTAQKLGTSTDPRLARIGNRMKDSFINYRRSMTGVAFGQAEGAEYASMAPDFSKTLPLNEAKIAGLLDAMASRDAEFWERKLGKAGAQLVGVLPETGAATPGAPTPPPTGAPRIEYDAQGNRKKPRK